MVTRFRMILLIGVILVSAAQAVVWAQDEDEGEVRDEPISYGMTVSDSIGDRLIFDFWRFNASAGDQIAITMTGSNGLAPLIGVADSARDVFAQSNVTEDGTPLPEAEPNGVAEMTLTLTEAGEYSIVATRVGNVDGDTMGDYTLTLQLLNDEGLSSDLQDVTFRCNTLIATTAATLDFTATDDSEGYRLSVYGFDGFQPVIHATAGDRGQLDVCSEDSQAMGGDEATLPGEETIRLPEGDSQENAVQYGLRGGEALGPVSFTIGSIDGAPGRYLAVIDGFKITPTLPAVYLDARIGPLATSSELLIYMVKTGQNRLDPKLTQLILPPNEPSIEIVCDDAGARDCADTPPLGDAGVVFRNGLEVTGGRFDAGFKLTPGDVERMTLIFAGQNPNATGDFAMVVIGELPPRVNDGG